MITQIVRPSNIVKNEIRAKLKDKYLALFFTAGISLEMWHDVGRIEREVVLYNELSKYFKHIYFFTYGGKEDLKYKSYLADNITIVPKKYISSNLLYSCVMPFIYHKILKNVDILKTNQIWGSWSAVLTRLIYRKKLIARAGYVLSINFAKENPESRIRKLIVKFVEMLAYKIADGIITTSKSNLEYIERHYNPTGIHVLIPNHVQTEIFKPLGLAKKKNSICFIGRLTKEKNLFALLKALEGFSYTITILGSGEQEEQLKKFAIKHGIQAEFPGNIPNHELPVILNQHEIFILPSLWEGMPKALLEAMACEMPVIGTKINGTKEVIEHGRNGLLCDTDSNSIREAIINLMEDDKLKKDLGKSARRTIVESYSLERLVKKELGLAGELSL